jgi:hypothetical protein
MRILRRFGRPAAPWWKRLAIRFSPTNVTDRALAELFHLSITTIRKYRYGLERNRPPACRANRLRVQPTTPVLDVPAGPETVQGRTQ